MNHEPSGNLPLHRRLSFRVLVPIVGFTLLLGVMTFGYSIYTLSRFTDQQAETSLRLHANTVRQIADDHLEKPRLANGGDQTRQNRRIEALLTIEDFARANGLQIEILDRSNQRRTVLGDLDVDVPAALRAHPGGQQSFMVGERRFQTHTVSFARWNWEVSLVGDSQSYVALKSELLRGAAVAAAVLVGATLLFLVYLVSLTQRPTRAIIDDIKAGRPPHYKGIAEFEFLGESIAGMMQELMEKSLALERYRDHLEKLVDERTSELTAANRKLQDLNHKLENSQQQLLQAEKLAAIGQLAAGVAHEINNPIGFVNSNLSVLGKYVQGLIHLIEAYERRPAGDDGGEIEALKQELDYEFLKDDVAQLFDESVNGLGRVKKIVLDLRDFSRIGDREWKRADLNKGLDTTLNIVANELKYKAKVIKDYGELPEIECLPGELNQVFLNLLVNAGHAIHEQGEIVIRTRCAEAEVIVEVSDNGCGIPAHVLPRIFDPFFTTKPVGQGTGLGLALSYGIALKHRGRFEVESTVGKGTTFRLHLPVEQSNTAPARPDGGAAHEE